MRKALREACSPELFATDAAYQLVMEQGMPFRDAYHTIAKIAHDLPPMDPDKALRERTHLGASGNLGSIMSAWIADETPAFNTSTIGLRAR